MQAAEVGEVVVGFARTLRHAGVDATPERVQAAVGALDALDASDRSAVYWSGRLTLCSEPDDIAAYDAAFAAYFGGEVPAHPVPGTPATVRWQPPSLYGTEPAGGNGFAATDGSVVPTVASEADVLRHRDVATLSDAERAEVHRLVSLLAPATAPRSSRRHRPASRGPADARRTVRRMIRQLGEPTRLAHSRRRTKPRRLVLLLDISGSMTPYADGLLRFGHAAIRRRPTLTEVFTVGTRLTRLTRALRHRDPDAALAAASRAIPDWHGGTRLAESVQVFLQRWGRRGLARGAVVVVCSDGWERGDPDELAEQVAYLSRLAYRLVWVNPHRGKPGFAPLAGGMAAALPYLDDLVAGHSLASLERLVEVIAHA